MKAYIMGNYTEKAFQGFLKDPKTDRKAVVEQLTKAMGGTMHSMDIVRGSYDFVVVNELNRVFRIIGPLSWWWRPRNEFIALATAFESETRSGRTPNQARPALAGSLSQAGQDLCIHFNGTKEISKSQILVAPVLIIIVVCYGQDHDGCV